MINYVHICNHLLYFQSFILAQMAEAKSDQLVDNEEALDDDFFIDRSPEFDRAQKLKQASIDHRATQDNGFQQKKKELKEEKKGFEQSCNVALDANSKLLDELDEHVKQMQQIRTQENALSKEQVEKKYCDRSFRDGYQKLHR
jgi:hypothetical protein